MAYKVIFDRIRTERSQIEVDLGDGEGYKLYNVDELLSDGINVPETCTNFDDIKFKTNKNEEIGNLFLNVHISNFEGSESTWQAQNKSRFQNSAIKRIIVTTDYINASNQKCIPEDAFSTLTNLEEVILDGDIQDISNYAFYNCTNLKKVTMPNTVEYIRLGAFSGCTSLNNINLSTNLQSIQNDAFRNCTSLQSIILPDGLKSITKQAFAYAGLTSLTIPATVRSLGEIVFAYTKLETVNIEVENRDEFSFSALPRACFAQCKQLRSINLPGGTYGIKSLGEATFYNCTALQSLDIPEGVTSIGDNAITNCGQLKTLTIPSTVETLGASNISYCQNLETLNMPNSTLTLGLGRLTQDFKLTTINHPNYFVSNYILYHKEINSETGEEVKTLLGSYGSGPSGDFTFPEGITITAISNNMFKACTNMTSITIPETVTTIGDNAFYQCSKLTSIVIPDSVTSIGTQAFYNCQNLESVHLPNSLISMGDKAFGHCSKLISSGIEWPTNPSQIAFGTNVFEYCYALATVTLPDGLQVVPSNMFYNVGMSNVTLPASITTIANNAFYLPTAMYDITITYLGTRSQWSSVSKGNMASSYTSVIVHCVDDA